MNADSCRIISHGSNQFIDESPSVNATHHVHVAFVSSVASLPPSLHPSLPRRPSLSHRRVQTLRDLRDCYRRFLSFSALHVERCFPIPTAVVVIELF